MNIKYLAILPLLVIGALGAYFLGKNTPKPATPTAKAEIQSQIDGIQAVQTNPNTGEIEYRLTAKRLTQNVSGQDELQEVAMEWTPNKTSRYTITAQRAIFVQASGDFDFGGGFVLVDEFAKDGKMTLTGDSLIGNTKSKLIKSDTPLSVKQGDSQFFAKAMTADLNSKDYQFFGIEVSFAPPKRQDKALF